jgi:hypothetical protein
VERLGLSARSVRSLALVGEAFRAFPRLEEALAAGTLGWSKVRLLASLPEDERRADWISRASRVTAALLSKMVRAVDRGSLEDTDPDEFRRTGGLPVEAGDERAVADREIGARRRVPATDTPTGLEPCSVRFFGPAEVVQLFKAVLCTVRRRMETMEGRLPTEGQALGAILDHVLTCWGALDGRGAARHPVFARDGWRCAVPGCTSMQNLHDHHIRFRSAGGSNEPANRVTLCAFHHLRGVHAARLRCVGRAPDGLTWQMGLRPGVAPVVACRSGDIALWRPNRASGA